MKWKISRRGEVIGTVRGTMNPNPYQSSSRKEPAPIDGSTTNQVIPSIWSIPIDIIGSWLPFGMVVLLFLPSLHELPEVNLGRLVFELSVIVVAITFGAFITLKRLLILSQRIANGGQTKNADYNPIGPDSFALRLSNTTLIDFSSRQIKMSHEQSIGPKCSIDAL